MVLYGLSTLPVPVVSLPLVETKYVFGCTSESAGFVAQYSVFAVDEIVKTCVLIPSPAGYAAPLMAAIERLFVITADDMVVTPDVSWKVSAAFPAGAPELLYITCVSEPPTGDTHDVTPAPSVDKTSPDAPADTGSDSSQVVVTGFG